MTVFIIFLLLCGAGFMVSARWKVAGADKQVGVGVPDLKVSVIIPARNEQHNLPKLLKSLAAQSPSPQQILVVDDGSTDDTAELARKHGATVIPSLPLPDGWRGKPWACHQGASVATGDLLLFVDADTWFEPRGFARMLHRYPGGAFSILPYHAVRRPYENLSFFFNFCMAAGTIPSGLTGQCLMVGRDDYHASGGHAAVSACVLENFRLAEEFLCVGIPVASVSGHEMLSIRMYPEGVASLVEGWTKGFASGAVRTERWLLILVVAWMTGLMLPLLAGVMTGEWRLWLFAYFLGVGQYALFARRLGSFHWLGAALYPLPLLFFFMVFGWSGWRSGKKVTWKGREIHAD